MILFLDSPATPKGEKREERVKAKKKEKGLDCSDWKPETSLSPPRKKRVEEPKDRYLFWDGETGLTLNMSSDSTSVYRPSFRLHTPGGGYCYSPLQCPLWGPSWPLQTDSRDSNRPSLVGLHLEGCRDRRGSVPAGQLLITKVFPITKTSQRAVVPNLCWHQGPVSWKTIFPWVVGWQEG